MEQDDGHISFNDSARVNRILEVIMAYARLDFSQKTDVLGNDDILDAIGAGVNMLGEELETSTISLREKEQLLKEVHHRVKNNLQIVSSLLSLQSDNIYDERFLGMISDSRNRINSMALVHEMLYSSKDLGRIEVAGYMRKLGNSIHQSLCKPNANINFYFNIEPDLTFDIDHMIPLGLIINEIVSNSFKFAFPGNSGQVNIELARQEGGYLLSVSDDGIGLPENFEVEKHANLGIQLIFMLSEQIEGKVEIGRHNGTCYRISFND